MRIALDFDGVVADGSTYFPEERRGPALYLGLPPYDPSTAGILETLCLHHEVYIITARHYRSGLGDITLWLQRLGVPHQFLAGILTYVEPTAKVAVATALRADVFVEDHPLTFKQAAESFPGLALLMNNPGWLANLAIATPNRVSSWTELKERIDQFARSNTPQLP